MDGGNWYVANRLSRYQCQYRRGMLCHNRNNEKRTCRKTPCPLITRNQSIILSLDNEVIVIAKHDSIPTIDLSTELRSVITLIGNQRNTDAMEHLRKIIKRLQED